MSEAMQEQPENPQNEEEKIAQLAAEALGEDDAAIDTEVSEVDALAELEAQKAELKDQLVRALAETENVRKRAQRDLEDTNKFAVSKFAGGLVPVLENLQRATSSISEELRAENDQVKNLAEGVEMTLRELLSVFERFGIKRIDPQGEKFDHNFHQAMQQLEDDSVEAGTVLQVLQAGYSIHERLLQPALVNVSKRSAGGGDSTAQHVDTQA